MGWGIVPGCLDRSGPLYSTNLSNRISQNGLRIAELPLVDVMLAAVHQYEISDV